VVAVAPGRGGGRSLVLYGHTDTVGIGGMADPHRPHIEGQRLFGRGAYDMKGGLAAAMWAAAHAATDNLKGDVIVAALADEEYASVGCQRFLSQWQADGAVIAEPTDLRLCLAHKGFAWFEIETFGRAAHGSDVAHGIDAIAEIGRVLQALEKLGDDLAGRPSHNLVGRPSVHSSLITGGQELSTYPDHCRLQIERRTVPGERPHDLELELRVALEGVDYRDNRRYALRTVLVREPFELAPSHELVRAVCAAYERVLTDPEIIGESGWMDSALFQAAGVPCVVLGPIGGGAHSDVEWVDLDSVQHAADIYRETARLVCG
jgi:acetylornithine deacetylase